MEGKEQNLYEITQEEIMEKQDCRLHHGPMDVITRGGNELMNSYNSVTQNLLNEVNCLQRQLQDKNCELIEVRKENERLLDRIHELLVGANLREEAIEAKVRSDKSEVVKKIIKFGAPNHTHERHRLHELNSTIPWFKLAVVLGLAIYVSTAVRDGLDF